MVSVKFVSNFRLGLLGLLAVSIISVSVISFKISVVSGGTNSRDPRSVVLVLNPRPPKIPLPSGPQPFVTLYADEFYRGNIKISFKIGQKFRKSHISLKNRRLLSPLPKRG